MALTEQQLGPVLTDYHEGKGGLEATIWLSNAAATHGRKKRAALLAVITGVGVSVLTYVSLRSA